jgi:hypothetical protein
MFQGKPHRLCLVERIVSLQGEALEECGITALIQYPVARPINLPAGQRGDLRSGRVKGRGGAATNFHKAGVSIRESHSDATTRHVGEMVQCQPIVTRVLRTVMTTVCEELRTEHGPDFLVP